VQLTTKRGRKEGASIMNNPWRKGLDASSSSLGLDSSNVKDTWYLCKGRLDKACQVRKFQGSLEGDTTLGILSKIYCDNHHDARYIFYKVSSS
jgi:hypothetical protein